MSIEKLCRDLRRRLETNLPIRIERHEARELLEAAERCGIAETKLADFMRSGARMNSTLEMQQKGLAELERRLVDERSRVAVATIDVLLSAWEKSVREDGAAAPISFWGFVGEVRKKLESGEMKL